MLLPFLLAFIAGAAGRSLEPSPALRGLPATHILPDAKASTVEKAPVVWEKTPAWYHVNVDKARVTSAVAEIALINVDKSPADNVPVTTAVAWETGLIAAVEAIEGSTPIETIEKPADGWFHPLLLVTHIGESIYTAVTVLPALMTATLLVTIVTIVLFIFVLIRYIIDGSEVHWMAGLPSRTDFKLLSDGDFVKVVGHVVAVPGQTLPAPLSRTPCVAYSVSTDERTDTQTKKAPTKTSKVKSFCIQDEHGRLLLIHEHEALIYSLTSVREWTHSAAALPKEFAAFAPKKVDDKKLTRYREEVLEVGAKVCCVGAVSTRCNAHAQASLRPAYATLMFRDAQIPWKQMSQLSTEDWGKVASSVLVTSYRLLR